MERDVGPVIQYLTEREEFYKKEYSKKIREELERKFGKFGTDVYDDISKKLEDDEIDLECPECAAAATKFIESSNKLLQLAEDFADETYTDVAEDILSQANICIGPDLLLNSYKKFHPEYNKKSLSKDILKKIANKIVCLWIFRNGAYDELFTIELIEKIGYNQEHN